MESTVCRGCLRPLLDENSGRDIFDDIYDKKWSMKIYSGIELITGLKITKEEKLPQKICEVCFQNIKAYINFRIQLLKSRDILLIGVYQDSIKIPTDSKSIETESLLNTHSSKDHSSKDGLNEVVQKASDVNPYQSGSPRTPVNNFLSKTMSEDLINVDDSSTSLDVNSLQHENGETNDSVNCKLQNDQENNNLNDSDNSVDNSIGVNLEQIKQPEHDIESEIDVCSGEDDDVLELDVQKMKNETVEINSSSESDIEVCDYEPTGKRGNYNTLSPPIRF